MNVYRYRIGSFRLFYTIDESEILILIVDIEKRKDTYRNKQSIVQAAFRIMMTTYISILRGINVSGQKKIKMDQLKNLYESLYFKNVRTYIQSGNVIFKSSEPEISKLTHSIEEKIIRLRIRNLIIFMLHFYLNLQYNFLKMRQKKQKIILNSLFYQVKKYTFIVQTDMEEPS